MGGAGAPPPCHAPGCSSRSPPGPAYTIGTEACSGAHDWTRQCMAQGPPRAVERLHAVTLCIWPALTWCAPPALCRLREACAGLRLAGPSMLGIVRAAWRSRDGFRPPTCVGSPLRGGTAPTRIHGVAERACGAWTAAVGHSGPWVPGGRCDGASASGQRPQPPSRHRWEGPYAERSSTSQVHLEATPPPAGSNRVGGPVRQGDAATWGAPSARDLAGDGLASMDDDG